MLLIPCPDCGPRAETEFSCGGVSHIARPAGDVSAEAWAQYLFYADNPRGLIRERWCHRAGCGQWFNVARDTVTHEIRGVYRMTDPRPDFSPEAS